MLLVAVRTTVIEREATALFVPNADRPCVGLLGVPLHTIDLRLHARVHRPMLTCHTALADGLLTIITRRPQFGRLCPVPGQDPVPAAGHVTSRGCLEDRTISPSFA